MKKLIASASVAAMLIGAGPVHAGSEYKVLRLDPSNLLDQVWAFREMYAKSAVSDIAWSGSTASCDAGGVPLWVTLKSLQALNYWRAMAGLEPEDSYMAGAAAQQGALLVSANGGIAYDAAGMATTISSYTGTNCRNSVASVALTGKGIGVGADNAAAITALVAENGSAESNIQLKSRNEVLRGLTSAHAIGLAGTAGNVVAVTGAGAATGNLTVVPSQYTFPRSGFFPAAPGMVPQRFQAVGYARDPLSFGFSATLDGQDVAGVMRNKSDLQNLDNRYFVGGKLPSAPVVSGAGTRSLTATFTGVKNGSPTGSAAGSVSIALQLFDPAAFDDQLVESGWYWDSRSGVNDGGNGVAIEQLGDRAYIAAYTYRQDGSPVWYSGMCNVSNKSCSGTLKEYAGGKNLVGQGGQANEVGSVGPFSLSWTDKTQPTLSYPGGVMQLGRFKPMGGTDAASVPQTGWWWDRVGGEGWFVEVSGDYAFIANYSYDSAGQAVWYIASGSTSTDKLRLEGMPLQRCTGGRTISQAPGTRPIVDGSCQVVSTLNMTFTGTNKMSMQVGTAQPVTLSRYYLNTASAQ